jgi:hypothetical protein
MCECEHGGDLACISNKKVVVCVGSWDRESRNARGGNTGTQVGHVTQGVEIRCPKLLGFTVTQGVAIR